MGMGSEIEVRLYITERYQHSRRATQMYIKYGKSSCKLVDPCISQRHPSMICYAHGFLINPRLYCTCKRKEKKPKR